MCNSSNGTPFNQAHRPAFKRTGQKNRSNANCYDNIPNGLHTGAVAAGTRTMRPYYQRKLFTLYLIFLLVIVGVCPGVNLTANAHSGKPADSPTSVYSDTKYEALYDEIWTLINGNYLYRDRLKSWTSWRHRFDKKMKTAREAEKAINAMIDSLSDEYTYYRNQTATQKRRLFGKKNHVVEHKLITGNVGYLKISTFNSVNCFPEAKTALLSMRDTQGLIIDLRDNWGGSIDTAFEVFSLLSAQGKFVKMKGICQESSYQEELILYRDYAVSKSEGQDLNLARQANLTGNKPMTILVNGNTKSAAEMLAGALKDNGRAIIVGETTFGKGIVQRVWDFPGDTSIKISSALFYLPGGACVHRVGLRPDVLVASSKKSEDKQLSQAQNLLRRGLVSMLAK